MLVGAGLGVVYAVAQLLQTVGLAHTEASRSGFITGTYVVLTPLLAAALLRDRVPRSTWAAVGLSAVGLAALSLQGTGGGSSGLGLGFGEAVTLGSAAVYALQIIGLGRWSSASAAAGLSAMQMIVIAAVCVVAAAPGGIALPAGTGAWTSVLYMALVAGALAIWGQTWAQSHLPATRAAIVMTLEPVFAAGFAVAFGGEALDRAGCCSVARWSSPRCTSSSSPAAAATPPRRRTRRPSCCTTRCEIRRTLTHHDVPPWCTTSRG